jgi:hypothetical protein
MRQVALYRPIGCRASRFFGGTPSSFLKKAEKKKMNK